jgi:archaellum component FlaC
MEITWKIISNTGTPITGGAAATVLKLRRVLDGFLYDWNSNTFKASGWGAVSTTLAEVDAVNLAGVYAKTVTITSFDDGMYQAFADYTASTPNLFASIEISIIDGKLAFEALDAGIVAVPDTVWDELLTGATHNIATSAGRRLRQIAENIITDGIAQGAGTGSNQIQLATDASSVSGAYDPSVVSIVSGTGAGQCRAILEYDGSTRTATVNRDWKVLPNATSEYIITPFVDIYSVNEGLIRAATTNTVQLNALASTLNGAYVGQAVFLVSGTGQDQAGLVIAYNGTTQTATIDGTWGTIPDTTTAYVMIPRSPVLLDSTTTAQIDDIDADVETLLTNLATVDGNVDDIETLLGTVNGKVDTIDGNVNDIETLLNTVNGKVDVIDGNVDDVETLLNTVDGNVDDIETLLTTVSGKIDTVDGNVDDVETLLNTVDGKVDIIDTNVDSLLSLVGGSGLYAVTLQLYETSTTTPLSAVHVAAYAGSDLDASGDTNTSGQVVFHLDAGTYSMRYHKAGVTFSVIDTITITGDATITRYGTPVAIPVPTSGSSCTLYEYCYDQASNTPLASVTATAKIVDLPYDYDGKMHTGANITGTYSAVTGLVSWDIAQGATVLVTIEEVGVIRKRGTIPAQGSVRVGMLPE